MAGSRPLGGEDGGVSETRLTLSDGPPETVLPEPPAVAVVRLERAVALPPSLQRDAVADVVTAFPRWSLGWAALAERGRDDLEAYAYYRVGYHRGLDALRAAGWHGTGYVRWRHPANVGFLRCLDGLRRLAEAIGEADEVRRCEDFLRQLDPDWRPSPALGAAASTAGSAEPSGVDRPGSDGDRG